MLQFEHDPGDVKHDPLGANHSRGQLSRLLSSENNIKSCIFQLFHLIKQLYFFQSNT